MGGQAYKVGLDTEEAIGEWKVFAMQNKNLHRFLYRGYLAGLQGFEP